MITIKQLLELRNALTKDSKRREQVVNAVYDSFTGVFSEKSVERLKTVQEIIIPVISEISNAIDSIKKLGKSEYFPKSASDILEKEGALLTEIHDGYFRTFPDKRDMQKLKEKSLFLKRAASNEKFLLGEIDSELSKVAEKKRAVLAAWS